MSDVQLAPYRVLDDIPMPVGAGPLVARAERSDTYEVHVTTGFDALLERLVALVDGAGVTIVTDTTVEALYGPLLVRGLRDAGVDPLLRAVPAGEASKSLDRAVELWHWLAGTGAARRDVLVAFGGGVSPISAAGSRAPTCAACRT